MAVPYRISNFLRLILMSLAAIGDGVQFLTVILWPTVILGILAYGLSMFITLILILTIGVIFILNGVAPLSGAHAGRKLTTLFFTSMAECIPIVNQLMPSLTIWTGTIIYLSRKEDAERAKRSATMGAVGRMQERQMLRAQRREQQRLEEELRASQRQSLSRARRVLKRRASGSYARPYQERREQTASQDPRTSLGVRRNEPSRLITQGVLHSATEEKVFPPQRQRLPRRNEGERQIGNTPPKMRTMQQDTRSQQKAA